MTNDLIQPDGTYNPEYIEWLFKNLTLTALRLSEITASVDVNGYVWLPFKEAAEIVSDIQLFALRVQGEEENIKAAMEHYNTSEKFIKEKGLKGEYGKFVCDYFSK